MKKIFVAVLLISGCATTRPSEESLELQALRQLIADQSAEIEQLKARTSGTHGASDVSNATIAQVESRRVTRRGSQAAAVLPPMPAGQLAWLYRDPVGCDRKSPFSLELHNHHDNLSVQVLIDGKPLVVLGASGPLYATTADGSQITPIPPDGRPFTCLDAKGWHTLGFVFYGKRRIGATDVLKEVSRNETRIDFNNNNKPETFDITSYYSY